MPVPRDKAFSIDVGAVAGAIAERPDGLKCREKKEGDAKQKGDWRD